MKASTSILLFDEVVLEDPGVRSNLCHQKLHRSGCEGGPFFVEGRALHVIEWKHWTLFYRVDNRQHLIFSNTDVLRDKLIDQLIRQRTPLTFWEPQPLGSDMPTPEQVDAFVSLPLLAAEAPPLDAAEFDPPK